MNEIVCKKICKHKLHFLGQRQMNSPMNNQNLPQFQGPTTVSHYFFNVTLYIVILNYYVCSNVYFQCFFFNLMNSF